MNQDTHITNRENVLAGMSCMEDPLVVEESAAQYVMIKTTVFLSNGGANQIHIQPKAKIIVKHRHLAHMTCLQYQDLHGVLSCMLKVIICNPNYNYITM